MSWDFIKGNLQEAYWSNRPFSEMAPAERGLETWGISFQYGGKHGEKCAAEWKLRARYFRVCE